MTTRTRERKSPRMWAGALFILAFLGCATGPSIGTDAQKGYFDREGNAFYRSLDAEAKKSSQKISPDTIVIGLLTNTHGGKNLTYIPSELRVVHKETTPVTWLAWDGKFTLEFNPRNDPTTGRPQNWPFEEKEEPIEGTTTGAIHSATKTVRANADKGAYHFKRNFWNNEVLQIMEDFLQGKKLVSAK